RLDRAPVHHPAGAVPDDHRPLSGLAARQVEQDHRLDPGRGRRIEHLRQPLDRRRRRGRLEGGHHARPLLRRGGYRLARRLASVASTAEDYRPGRLLGLMARSLVLPTAAPAGAGVAAEPRGGISVTYVGHATALVRFEGVTLLTDPVYSSRLILPKRLVAPGVPLAGLPPLDVVLVSHGHMDHLDVPTHRR